MTTRGEGADTPVWTLSGHTKDANSSLDSKPEGDSSLGSNPSNQPHRGTDTQSQRGFTLQSSLDPTREPMEDDPISDRGDSDGDQNMPDANEQQGARDPMESGPGPVPMPEEEGVQVGDDRMEFGQDGEPQEPEEPQEPIEPYQIILQGF